MVSRIGFGNNFQKKNSSDRVIKGNKIERSKIGITKTFYQIKNFNATWCCLVFSGREVDRDLFSRLREKSINLNYHEYDSAK